MKVNHRVPEGPFRERVRKCKAPGEAFIGSDKRETGQRQRKITTFWSGQTQQNPMAAQWDSLRLQSARDCLGNVRSSVGMDFV